jgi:outer membrane receptor for ferrienterochelin and colicins
MQQVPILLRIARACRVAGALCLLPAALTAQTGSIAGTVTGTAGTPLADALVSVSGTGLSTATRFDGRYAVTGVRAGSHSVVVRRIGYAPRTVTGVTVTANGTVTVDVSLEPAAQQLGGLVVSASRRVEKVTDAPATITRLESEAFSNASGNGISGALKQVMGIDYIQVGMTAVAINARGFNSSFNNRMLQIEDGRVAQLGENGLPIGNFSPIPRVDIAAVEVLVGPGSALYGPDASNGVLYVESKDPRQFPGTTVEVTGGNRGFFDVQARHAGNSGKWGYKIAGNFIRADDFENAINYGAVAGGPSRTPEIGLDFTAKSLRGYGALAYYSGESRLQFSGGYSTSDGVGQTNVGRNQLDDYSYNTLQAKFTSPRWYATVYRNGSSTGDTYAANAYSQNKILFPNLPDDSVKHLSDFPGHSSIYAAELQNNFTLTQAMNTKITWGGQVRHDAVSSKRQWLDDRVTGEDITLNQVGVYGQIETPFNRYLRAVVSARYDKHEDYDGQFSPKAAILITPVEDNTFRVSYNKAFKSASILQRHFSAADFAAVTPTVSVGVFGNRDGFTVRNAAGTVVNNGTFAGLVPETNETWELGYKGVIRNRLFLDITGYVGNYDNFLSPLITLANPLAGTFAYDAAGNKYVGPTGKEQIFLTYLNLGKAKLKGVDAGFRLEISNKLGASGTFSLVDLEPVDTAGQRSQIVEATALNTTPTKYTLGMDVRNVGHAFGGFTFRSVEGYFFRSGIQLGAIPRFSTLDLNVGYNLPKLNSAVSLSVSNAYACSYGRYNLAATQAPPGTLDKTKKCGFGQKHTEMINMPEIGTMVFLGVRYHH